MIRKGRNAMFRTVCGTRSEEKGMAGAKHTWLCPEVTLELRVPLPLCGLLAWVKPTFVSLGSRESANPRSVP